MDRTEATISQNCYWSNIRDEKHTKIKDCTTFQRNNKQGLKCGHLPAKEAEAIPRDISLVYPIGQYKFRVELCDDPLIQKS